MKLLLTAFDPFGGDKVNPALEAVRLVSEKVGNVEVVKLEVPTVFRKSIATVATAIAKEKPDAVLCIGQAGETLPPRHHPRHCRQPLENMRRYPYRRRTDPLKNRQTVAPRSNSTRRHYLSEK
ncbi:MAG: hypothetical protein V8S98_09045 [Lachnospiraceae bacterium]